MAVDLEQVVALEVGLLEELEVEVDLEVVVEVE